MNAYHTTMLQYKQKLCFCNTFIEYKYKRQIFHIPQITANTNTLQSRTDIKNTH